MLSLSAVFVAVCMVLIAASSGAVSYLLLGFTGAESSIIGVAALTGLALYNTVSTRLRDRSDVGGQIADLSRGTADLARQVAEFSRRLSALESESLRGRAALATPAATPLAAELSELGIVVKELAETVAHHQTALANLTAAPAVVAEAAAPAVVPAAEPVATVAQAAPVETAPAPVAAPVAAKPAPVTLLPTGPLKGMEREAIVAAIREAVEANRIDLYLQPIVTLPQRKVRYYEAMVRLRTADGTLLAPTDFLPYAEGSGLMPKIDSMMLFRCVQVVRRLLSKNRDISLFCNVSASTLIDPQFFPQFADFMDANRAIAPSLVFEFTQAAYRAFGAIESESIAALAEHGFRFSMDNVTDLRLEPRDLADRGFRFIKVPAALLLNQADVKGNDIHPADFSGLLGRFGIELIAERIEGEGVVVDLLDYDVRFGQGFLFSPPRPVRPEALQGIADRNDVVVREAAAEPDAAPGPVAATPADPVAGARPAPPTRLGKAMVQLARNAAAS
jgi:cyclic-di-GMP phosphodiesterase TipF (flagellum assembly factor)